MHHVASSVPTLAEPASRIHLRRFAGPLAHTEQLGRPLRIAHLTDLHVGRVTPMRVQHAAVRLTNAERPDLVVLTGDFVCHSQLWLDALGEVVRGFEAPVVCVLGNHDHWCGAHEVRRALERAGALVLENAHTVLELGHERLQVVGLDDAYTGHADRDRALRGLRHDLPTLGLSHIAEEADRLWDRGVPLVLSGHTHGGQITVARLHELALGRIGGHRYIHGMYGERHGSRVGAVYVGAGIGAAVMPVRVGPRGEREVALFELGVAPGTMPEPMGTQSPRRGRKPSHRTRDKRRQKVARLELRRALRASRRR